MSDEFKPDIWRLQAQMDVEGLVIALEDPDPAIRRRAATALRALGAFDVIPQLEAALENETDGEARANLITALATLRQEKQYRAKHPEDPYDLHRPPSIDPEVQKLLDDLRSGDPLTIVRAAKHLGKRKEKAAVVTLVSLFNNIETPIKVRLVVAEVLLALESAPLEVSLLGALRREDDWKARRNAAAILGQLKAEWAVEPLIRCLSDENKTVRLTAYSALTNIGTPAALTALEAVKQRTQKRVEKEKSQTKHPAMDETQQIEWPPSQFDRSSAPTQKLNPRTLEDSDRYQSWAREAREARERKSDPPDEK